MTSAFHSVITEETLSHRVPAMHAEDFIYIHLHTHTLVYVCVCVVSLAVSILHQFTAELTFTLLMFPGLMRVNSPLTFFPQNSSFWKLFLFFFFCVFASVYNTAAQILLFTWSPTLV